MRVQMSRLIAILALTGVPLPAHHSITAAFDDSKTITLTGVISTVSWINPHVVLFVDVPGDGGKVVRWEVETESPNSLPRRGMDRNLLKPGDRITFGVWTAKDSSHRAFIRTLTFPDGRKIEMPPPGNWTMIEVKP